MEEKNIPSNAEELTILIDPAMKERVMWCLGRIRGVYGVKE